MPHSLLTLSALVLAIAAGVGCDRRIPPSMPVTPPVDTVYTREAAMEAMANDPDRALQIIDSACLVGNIPGFMADLLRMKVYSQSLEGLQLDSAFATGERLLQHDSVVQNPERRFAVLDLLVNASHLSADDEKLLQWTEQKSSLCQCGMDGLYHHGHIY